MKLKAAPKEDGKELTPVSFRFDLDTKKKLDDLSKVLRRGKTDIMKELIALAYESNVKKSKRQV